MSSVHLAFSSRAPGGARPLSDLPEGTRGTIVEIHATRNRPVDRLLALGVAPGAIVKVMQTFPGVVFLCDQTELAVERSVARTILVRPMEAVS